MSPQGYTMYDVLLRNASNFGERTAVVYDGGTLTHKQLLKKVDALATGLAGHALGRGERICILAQNYVEYFELYFACAKLGIIAYPINWRLTSEEVGHVLERARPRMFVTDSASLALVADWPQKHREIPYWYQFGAQPGEGYTPFGRLYIEGGAEEAPAVEGDDTFMVISTAAVDVIPRGAALSHNNVLASNLQTIATMGLNETDCHLMALPLFHITALGWGLTVAHAGGCNVITTKFDAAASIKLIDEHKVTVVAGFPPVLKTLLDEAEKAGSKLPSLRHATGLEFPETIERLQKATKATFWTGFGQSETSGFVTIQRYNDRPGGSGRTGLMAKVKLVDDAEQDVPVGTPGEIVVRGPLVMKEYYAQPDVTAHTFRNGWHHTGDVGRLDEQGFLFYVKRKPEKELIKPGGENVYPAEVEAVILQLKGVSGVCVFGVPDAQWGEAIKAVVEAKGLSAQQVIDHVAGKIARFKKPKFVEFTDKLPRGKDGAVDRDAVKQTWGKAG